MYRNLYQLRAHWQAAAPTSYVRFPLHGAQSLFLSSTGNFTLFNSFSRC